jgi:hypothetical protein
VVASPKFKRMHSVATSIACAGVLLAAGALWLQLRAP